LSRLDLLELNRKEAATQSTTEDSSTTLPTVIEQPDVAITKEQKTKRTTRKKAL
jgi:hypothetical protein